MVRSLWASLRCIQQEYRIRREQEYYERTAKISHAYPLDNIALKERLLRRLSQRGITPRPTDNLHVVYATPLSEWEKLAIPPALSKFGTISEFFLKENGFDIFATDWKKRRHELDDSLYRFVERCNKKKKVDVLFSYLSGYLIRPETIQRINSLGVITCAMWLDDRLSFKGYRHGGRHEGTVGLAPAYDLNLTNASKSIVKYFVEGGLAMFWPPGADPDHFRPLNRPFRYDVSFVGSCYGRRKDYVEYLRNHGLSVFAFGSGWDDGQIDAKRMIEIYSESRINLGFSGIGYSMKETCLKGRDFEVPMTGAVYLTTAQPDLDRVFHVGDEVHIYHDKLDLLNKLRMLLHEPEICASTRIRARQRCVQSHTWYHRFETLFRIFGFID